MWTSLNDVWPKGREVVQEKWGRKESFITMARLPPCKELGNDFIVKPGGAIGLHSLLNHQPVYVLVMHKTSTSTSVKKLTISVHFWGVPTKSVLNNVTQSWPCVCLGWDKRRTWTISSKLPKGQFTECEGDNKNFPTFCLVFQPCMVVFLQFYSYREIMARVNVQGAGIVQWLERWTLITLVNIQYML